MLGSDWLKFLKVVGLGLGSLVAVLLIYFAGYGMGSAGGYFDAQANGYSAQYPTDTDQRVDRCYREALPPRVTQACVSQAVQASHENQRTEQDLSAQRKSADWARWIFIITLAQLPLTALGLVFLLRTIHQGQEGLASAAEANQIALDSSKRQLAPYIDIAKHIAERDLSEDTEDGVGYYAHLEFKNYGVTPALNFKYRLEARLSEGDSDGLVEGVELLGRESADAGTIAQSDSIKTNFTFVVPKAHSADISASKVRVLIGIRISFEDGFGDRHERKHTYVTNKDMHLLRVVYVEDPAEETGDEAEKA